MKKKNKLGWEKNLSAIGAIATIMGCIAAWLVVPGFQDKFTDFFTHLNNFEGQEINEIFPISIGNKWHYKINQTTSGKNLEEKLTQGEFSISVVNYITGLSDKAKIIRLEIDGRDYIHECTNFQSFTGKKDVWYVMDKHRLFITCSESDAYKIAKEITFNKSELQELPSYISPMKIGTKWDRFQKGDIKKFDNTYVWFIEAITDISVPAGNFKACYRILLDTRPDDTIRYVYPGVGLVSELYTHHGSRNDYTIELVDFSVH